MAVITPTTVKQTPAKVTPAPMPKAQPRQVAMPQPISNPVTVSTEDKKKTYKVMSFTKDRFNVFETILNNGWKIESITPLPEQPASVLVILFKFIEEKE